MEQKIMEFLYNFVYSFYEGKHSFHVQIQFCWIQSDISILDTEMLIQIYSFSYIIDSAWQLILIVSQQSYLVTDSN